MVKILKDKLTLVNVLIGIMLLLLGVVGISIRASYAATTRAQTALDASTGVMNELKLHVAEQKGQFEGIESQLNTLRTYHSTLRGDIKDSKAERRENMKEVKDLLHGLMTIGHQHPNYSSGLPDHTPATAVSTD
jgi:septal ring factor EnvC (AmiA/AmiB activator)